MGDLTIQDIYSGMLLVGLIITTVLNIRSLSGGGKQERIELERRLVTIEQTVKRIEDGLIKTHLAERVDRLEGRVTTIETRGCGNCPPPNTKET